MAGPWANEGRLVANDHLLIKIFNSNDRRYLSLKVLRSSLCLALSTEFESSMGDCKLLRLRKYLCGCLPRLVFLDVQVLLRHYGLFSSYHRYLFLVLTLVPTEVEVALSHSGDSFPIYLLSEVLVIEPVHVIS